MTHFSFSSRYWQKCKTTEFEQCRAANADLIALVPLGATEQHGPHLPLSVDSDLVNGMVARTLPLLPDSLTLLVLPTVTVSHSVEHAVFAGTLTLSARSLMTQLAEWIDCVVISGVKKLVFFNAHGGNIALMDIVGREARAKHGILVHSVSWFNLPLVSVEGLDLTQWWGDEEWRYGAHGGAFETSMMLALDAGLVDRNLAQNFVSYSQEKSLKFRLIGDGRSSKEAWMAQDYNVQGAMGRADLANAQQGEMILGAVAQSLAQLLQEVGQQRQPISVKKS